MEYDYDENEFLIEDTRRYIVLVIYDITDNKRRTKMVKCLERYGVRVQKSAFEAFLTERKYDELVARTTHLIDPHTDSLRIYLLANHTSVRSWGIGDRHVEDVIIFYRPKAWSDCSEGDNVLYSKMKSAPHLEP